MLFSVWRKIDLVREVMEHLEEIDLMFYIYVASIGAMRN